MSAVQQFTWQEDRFPHKDALPELATNIHGVSHLPPNSLKKYEDNPTTPTCLTLN